MVKQITPISKEEWRKWLEKNHLIEDKISVVCFKKHTGKPIISHRELMFEAICFGWIDTTIKTLDEDKYLRHFSKRTKNSRWSDNTISYGKQLLKDGKMSEFGLKMFNEGLAKLTHDADIPKDPEVPKEMKKIFEKDTKARESFEKLAPSYRRAYLRWILRAKGKETREKRILETLERVKVGKKMGV